MLHDIPTLRTQIKDEFTEKLVSCFLEIFVMAGFRDTSFSGYDALKLVEERFGILLSPGRIYYTIRSMEKKKLLDGSYHKRKKVYKVTELGILTLEIVISDEMRAFMVNITKP